jgi:hypothetical protein
MIQTALTLKGHATKAGAEASGVVMIESSTDGETVCPS